ncbi:MAG: AAA family ATPase [Chloroflexi bacterium]|nr:AAA family ATPase [Chloroflexota bacterium]
MPKGTPVAGPEDLKKILAQATTIAQLGVSSSLAVDLIYRILFTEGDVNVGRIVEVTRLYPQIVDDLMADLQHDHLVEVVKAGALRVSYTYRLTDEGASRARDAMARTQYVGPFPVEIDAYRKAVIAQTNDRRRLGPAEVKQALAHLTLPEQFHRRIGPAINSGSSLFLYGPPGNGKTTVAQAIAKLLGGSDPIWLPYAITIGGQIIQVHDPMVHVPFRSAGESESPTGKTSFIGVDKRWGLFQRPGVMVGGELTLEALELRFEPVTKIYEAPLQLKANGGMFLIDDFGRQTISPQQLLNRWIVPLETRIDFLRLYSGQTLEIPFRQLIVFATNLDPSALVDAAFLRRIQMKVELGAPDEKMFYQIMTQMCQHYKIPLDKAGFVHLLQRWYRDAKRPMQSVHPRDLLKTILAIADYAGITPEMTPDLIDEACSCYFVDSATPV